MLGRDGFMPNATRIKYKDQGTCSWCPRPRYAAPDHTYALCYEHLTQSRANQAKRMDRPKLGLCRRCSKVVEYGRTLCEYHLDYEQKRILKSLDYNDNSPFMI